MARSSAGDVNVLAALAASANVTRERNAAGAAARKSAPKRKGVVLSVSVPVDDAEFMRAAAESHSLSLSAYIRLACREFERQHT